MLHGGVPRAASGRRPRRAQRDGNVRDGVRFTRVADLAGQVRPVVDLAAVLRRGKEHVRFAFPLGGVVVVGAPVLRHGVRVPLAPAAVRPLALDRAPLVMGRAWSPRPEERVAARLWRGVKHHVLHVRLQPFFLVIVAVSAPIPTDRVRIPARGDARFSVASSPAAAVPHDALPVGEVPGAALLGGGEEHETFCHITEQPLLRI